MDAILYVAMIHLSSTENTKAGSLPIYEYRNRALRSLRQAVLDTSPEKIRATSSDFPSRGCIVSS